MQVFWSEQYDGIPEIKNSAILLHFNHHHVHQNNCKSLHQPIYCHVTNIHIKHVPYIRNQKWLHRMAGSCVT